MSETKSPAEARQKLCDLIREIRIAMVTTVEADGSLRARPMVAHLLEDDPNHIYFVTSIESHKVEEIEARPEMNMTFARGGDYVSVSGRAWVSRDPALIDRLWTEADRAWFPKGRKDPDICVMRVALSYGEYWDPPSAAIGMAYGWTKAVLTGRSADGDLGDNQKIGRIG